MPGRYVTMVMVLDLQLYTSLFKSLYWLDFYKWSPLTVPSWGINTKNKTLEIKLFFPMFSLSVHPGFTHTLVHVFLYYVLLKYFPKYLFFKNIIFIGMYSS